MNKYIISGIVILIAIAGFLFFQNNQSEPETVEVNLNNDILVMEDEIEKMEASHEYQVELLDVTDGNTVRGVTTTEDSSGLVTVTYQTDKYSLLATFEGLPEPQGTDFYEGWVVRRDPLDVISTGRLEKNNESYINTFETDIDLTDHDFYVLTLEPDDDDPAPADHIFEGELSLVSSLMDESLEDLNINTMQNLDTITRATLKTNLGDITVEFYREDSPKTVENFLKLASDGFYDGVKFHRVIKDFMIQTGDPLSKDDSKQSLWGTGDPGYKFADEFNDQTLVQGSLAMANSGPDTNGSQFFIVTAPATAWLDGLHTNFGKVVDGLDIVLAIGNVATEGPDRPVEAVVIESIELK